jgi:hypothetical protein
MRHVFGGLMLALTLFCAPAALAETHGGAHFWACADAAWDVYQQAKTDAEMVAKERELEVA